MAAEPGNGSYVTWRELNLVLQRLDGIAADVKSLLDSRAEERGRDSGSKDSRGRRLAWAALAVSGLAGIGSIVGALLH